MTDTADGQSPLEFPCRFPIKMMGRPDGEFRDIALSIIEKHAGSIDEANIRSIPSRAGNFVSITVTIDATSQVQLDAIYRELSANTAVLVAL